MNRLHIPIGDAYEVQTWDEIHDKWTVWSYGSTFAEAQAGSDHARDQNGLAKTKVRIVKL